MRQLSWGKKLISVMALSFLAQAGFAQTASTGAISGLVTDPSGAVVSEVNVTATNETSGDRRSAVSTSSGRYMVPLLAPGRYRVQATKGGFKELARSGITVYVTETAVANLQLTVGAATEVVNVTSEAELLNVQDSAMGKVTNELVVSSLPLVTRNYTQIIGLSPGVASEVANAGALGRGAGSDAVGANGFSVHGGPTNDNNYQVNGVEVNDLMGSGSFSGGIAVPNPDTIQEFKVQTGQFDASYGRNAGANVDLVTKRGTNALHGTLFEFFRNDVLNANEYFLNRNNQPRAVLKQNQFGGSLGGPIAKDKLFFFGSYQGTRQRNGLDEDCLSTVNSPPITDDRSAAALGALFNGPSGGAIAADGSNISPQALTLLNLQLPNGEYVVPTPQSINSGEPFFLQGSSTFSRACPFTEDQFLASMDYLQSTKSTLTGRFFYSDDAQVSTVPSNANIDGGGVPGFPHHVDNDFRVFSLTHTYSFSPNVVNQATLGYHRLLGRISQDEPFTFADLGVNAPAFDDAFPKIGVVGAFQTGGNGQGVRIAQNIYSFNDSVLWSVGRHALHFGGGIERSQINQLDFHFFGGVQFPDYTQFLLGNATFILDVPGLFDRLWRTWDGSLFLQDDIKLGPRFTLNLGLRYERLGHLTDELGRNSSFDPERADHTGAGSQAGYVVASNLKDVTLPPGVIRAPNEAANNGLGQNAWGPRVGFAWQLPGTNHAVLRGGYGIYYSRTTAQPILQELTGPPFGQVRLLQTLGTPFADPFPPAPTLPSFPTYSAATCTIPLLDPNCVSFVNVAIDAQPPLTQHYSLNTQVELRSDLALEVGYQGARGTRLWEFRNFNQALSATPESPINGETENTFFNITPRTPVPGISPFGAGQVKSTGASWYNALVASLHKRFSHGLQFLASYTWASALGTSQGFATGTQLGGQALGDQNDPGARYGWDGFVRPHRFVFSWVYQLPGVGARRSALNKLLGGWSVAGVTTVQSGQRLTVDAINAQNVFGIVTDRAPFSNATGCDNRFVTSGSVQSKLDNYINIPCFDLTVNEYPVIGTDGIGTDFGTSGIGVVRGPAQNNWDLALSKRTGLGFSESAQLEFRAEFFNAFNHPQFANPDLSAGLSAPALGLVAPNPGFGQITQMSTNPRIIQLALKLAF